MLGEGVNGHRTLFKMLIMNFLHFQSTFLEGREGDTKKSTLCTLLIMLTIMDDS